MEIAGQDAELPEIQAARALLRAVRAGRCSWRIAGRLFYLQVIEGDVFFRLTSDSIIKTEPLPAVRGQIRDRKGKVLATVRPSYNVYVTPGAVTPRGLRAAARAAGHERRPGDRRVGADPGHAARRQRARAERPMLMAEDISREAMASIETGADLPGVKIVSVPRRSYPFGTMAAHVLGFMNEISAEELRAKKDEGYRPGDLIGRTGIERQWDGYLRGHAGFHKVVVDRRGLPKTDIRDIVEGPSTQAAVPGNNVVLTLDADVQKIAERALRAVPAAGAVVMDVDTGRILAMVSKPAFDPERDVGPPDAGGRAAAARRSLQAAARQDGGRDLLPGVDVQGGVGDRGAGGSAGHAGREDQVPRLSSSWRGTRFRCTKTHGIVNLYDAIVQSCNVYFYELGARPGMMDRLAKFGADLGLGAPTGLGLNSEEGGFLPTEEWYRDQKRKNPKAEGFQIGQAVNAVIGQGSTRVTLLQMATLYAAIANGGKLWLPQLVERVESPDGKVLEEFAPRVRRELAVSPETLAIVRQALVGVVNESKGTAFRARSEGHRGRGQDRHRAGAERHGRGRATSATTHAWFVGFAPAGRPQHRVRGAGRARRPRRRRRGAAGHGDRRQLLRDASRRPNARRRASGCCAGARRARRRRGPPAAAPPPRARRRPRRRPRRPQRRRRPRRPPAEEAQP